MTRNQLDAIRGKFADIPVAVYVPACAGGFTHPDTDNPFTIPHAIQLADEIRAATGHPDAAIVLVYGIPWEPA